MIVYLSVNTESVAGIKEIFIRDGKVGKGLKARKPELENTEVTKNRADNQTRMRPLNVFIM